MIDWRQRNATFFNALQVERNVMFLILTLIVLVAALNIVSGLIMLAKQRQRHRHPAHHGRDEQYVVSSAIKKKKPWYRMATRHFCRPIRHH